MFTKAGCIKTVVVIILFLVIATCLFYLIIFKKPVVEETPKPSIYENQVRVGITIRTLNLPFYALNDLIKGKSYELALVPFNDYDECWERLAAGSLDIVICPLDSIALGLARHKPGTIVFKVADSSVADAIVVKKNFLKPDDLVGKRIAVVPGSSGYMLLTLFLDKIGRTTQESDIILVIDQAQALEYLLSGRIDAAVLSDPYLQEALEKKCKVLNSSGAMPLIEEYCVVGNYFKKEHPDRIKDVVKAWFQVLEIIHKNPGLAKRLIGKNSRISPELLSEYLGRIKFSSLSENKSLRENEITNKIRKFQNFWSLVGEQNAHIPINFSESIDLSFITELEEGDIQSFVIDGVQLILPSVTPSPFISVIPSAPLPTKSAKMPTSYSITAPPLPTVVPSEMIEYLTPVPSNSISPSE